MGVIKNSVSKVGAHRRLRKNRGVRFSSYTGAWPQWVTIRVARGFNVERLPQVIRHTATTALGFLKTLDHFNGEAEIQVCFVNHRIIIASNSEGGAEKIATHAEHFLDIAKNTPKTFNTRQQRHSRKLVVRSAHPSPQARRYYAVLEKATKTNAVKIDMTKLNSGVKYTTDHAFRGSLLYVHGWNCHAEQKLAYLLVNDGCTDEAFIYGSKRPCLTCYATLSIACKNGRAKITMNERPGGYWQKPADDGLVWLADLILFKGLASVDQIHETMDRCAAENIHITDTEGLMADKVHDLKAQQAAGYGLKGADVDTDSDSDAEA